MRDRNLEPSLAITPNFPSSSHREIVGDYVEKNRYWSTTFHTLIVGGLDRECQ
jgi:hypothetical protein